MEEKELIYNSPKAIRRRSLTGFLSVTVAVVSLWLLSSLFSLRLDLTEDKRYTLSPVTRDILRSLDEDVYIEVYLEGEMPVQFRKLKRTASEMLEEFRLASGRRIDYSFINPSTESTAEKRNQDYLKLTEKGLNPVNIQASDEEGGSSQKIIFPGMLINYNNASVPVNFLRNDPSVSPDQNLTRSVEGLEYELIQTISTLVSDTVHKIAFIEGHGEADEAYVADITLALARYFTVDRGTIGGKPGILDSYSAVIVAGPEQEFGEADKLVLDQYIMKGGKVLWLLEEVVASEDSLAYGETVALYRPLRIEDQLFRYGARINPVIIQDVECLRIPMKVITGTQQQIVPVPWVYYPLLIPDARHPVTRNLNRVAARFSGYIDTVGLDPSVKKSVLLATSQTSRTVSPPFVISLKEADKLPDPEEFTKGQLPVAVLLEGTFRSAFRNRLTDDIPEARGLKLVKESLPTKMVVVADGNIIKNDVRRTGRELTPLPLGQDRYTLQVYGNRDFIVNVMNYLVDDKGMLDLRSREVKMRLLDRKALKSDKGIIIAVNLVAPVVFIALFGYVYMLIRRRKYTR
jgi:gliding-associated putative ABC transporter substrate-binding component GldG